MLVMVPRTDEPQVSCEVAEPAFESHHASVCGSVFLHPHVAELRPKPEALNSQPDSPIALEA